jgi:hypothetical protein
VVDGTEIPVYVSNEESAMNSDDGVYFYLPDAGAEVELHEVDGAKRMQDVDASVNPDGDQVYTASASEDGYAVLEVTNLYDRFLLIGFTKPPAMLFEVSDLLQPKLLTGFAVVEVDGEIGLYFSYPGVGPATVIAVDRAAIREVGSLRVPGS